MFRMTQKETEFFDLFVSSSEIAYKAAVSLQSLVLQYEDVEERIKGLEEKEHEADRIVHAMMDKLNKSFITPIDREDLFTIAKDLDSITDEINTTAHMFHMFNIQTIRPEAKSIVELIVAATERVHALTKEIKNFKKSSEKIREIVVEVNKLETESDVMYRAAMRSLFINEKDPIEIIKWRATYEALEEVLDTCEHVSNVILGVVVKHG